MTYVNELIPDADKPRIDWSRFRAWPHSPPYSPWKWTIDRELDVFLVFLEDGGREQERPQVYALYWHGEVIRFEARCRSANHAGGKFDLFWTLSGIELPAHLEPRRTEVLEDLKAALDAHGVTYKRAEVNEVHIEIR
ncbi:MAG: hypothetical protein EPO12_17755 [Aquabacterium sp.]|nr:MAG: hypothetical protein EPO12_17755 [Aquabacterium sp.]